jgi:uncharacterized membrane protein
MRPIVHVVSIIVLASIFAAEGCSQSPNTIGEYAVSSSGMSGLAEKVNLSFYFPPPNLRIRAESSGNG